MENNKKNTVYKAVMLIIITAIVTFMITSIGMYNLFIKTDGKTDAIATNLEKMKRLLEKNYIGELDDENMKELAIKGYVEGVGDEYTEYLTKSEYEELIVNVTGDFTGIGIYMAKDTNGNIVVLMPIEGSPALEADLRPGDIIVKVNGEECKENDIDVIAAKIKGEEATTVELEILRDNQILTKTIERRVIEIPDSKSEILEGNIGYIVLSTFDEQCTNNIKEYLAEFESKGIKSVIFDFRNNTGGMVTEAINFSELFIPKGNVIMRSYDRDGKETVIESSSTETNNMKIVILVNEYSASATEIVTAALKDNNVATVVGTTTYGKGVMQEVIPVFKGALKVTIEEFKTPNGEKINKEGIKPDEFVEDNPETQEDEQLQKAIEILK